MSDYFGSNQSRVLDTQDRSLDNVVFQHRMPPLSSEWNLINQISNTKIQDSMKMDYPSGWFTIGDIQDLDNDSITEIAARSGQVLTSVSYDENSFKLVSKNPAQVSGKFGSCSCALVNGWPIFVYNGTLNNIITLDEPTTDSRYDLVFLEVWRKLIGANDPLYPYGCVQANPFSDNELVASFTGTETTKRVQIQYRIRTKRLDSGDVGDLLELDDLLCNIYPIAGRTSEYAYTSYKYRKFGSQDVGLYVSGYGESSDKSVLSTVDGYSYSIPMFLVYRRQKGTFDNTINGIHRSNITKQDYLDDIVSDRPDGKLVDVVYKDDIIDLRHRIISSREELDSIIKKSFRQLISGNLKTTLAKGFVDFSGTRQAFPGGNRILKRDQLNGTLSNIGNGIIMSNAFKNRAYSNAEFLQSNKMVTVSVATYSSGTWAAGTYNVTSLMPSSSVATVEKINGYYTKTLGKATNIYYNSGSITVGGNATTGPKTYISFNPITKTIIRTSGSFITDGFVNGCNITVSGSTSNDGIYAVSTVAATVITLQSTETLVLEAAGATITITDNASNLIGSTENLIIQFQVRYVAGNKGFFDVPSNFIEYNKNADIPYPLEEDIIYLRKNKSGDALQFTSSQTIQGITIKLADDETTSLDNIRHINTFNGESARFGTILSVHKIITSGTSTPSITIDLTDQKLYGYYILGVRAVYATLGGNFKWSGLTTGFRRNMSGDDIASYTINSFPLYTTPCIIRIELYVGSKPNIYDGLLEQEVYYPLESIKFFDTTKQARGITDIYEMMDVVVRRTSGNYFEVDTSKVTIGNKPILALGGLFNETNDADGSYFKITPYVYDISGVLHQDISVDGIGDSEEINKNLPCFLDNNYVNSNILPTKIIIKDITGDIVGDYIKVPIFVNSYVLASETPYNFYYNTEPYMGLMTPITEVRGKIENDGPSVITSEGSGAITNVEYNLGKAVLTKGSRVVTPLTYNSEIPKWSEIINPSKEYYISIVDSEIYYRIENIKTSLSYPNGYIVLSEPFKEASTGTSGITYEIVRKDYSISNISNIVDRLPTFLIKDYLGDCGKFDYHGIMTTFADSRAISKLQDPLDTIPYDFILGSSTNSNNITSRGVSNFIMTLGSNDSFNLSYPRPHIIYLDTDDGNYKKVYQAYLFNLIEPDSTKGRLYMMVLGSTPDPTLPTDLVYFNSNSANDTLDLFELVGRPLIK